MSYTRNIYVSPNIIQTKTSLKPLTISITITPVILLSILTYIFTLSYLGTTFNTNKKIDVRDWKRKWIIFFAWFNIGVYSVLTLLSFGEALILLILPLLTNIFILMYLGLTFETSVKIDSQDWKRKWIIFFTWLGLIISVLSLVSSK